MIRKKLQNNWLKMLSSQKVLISNIRTLRNNI